eukprot:TRINITY_DN17179_c0_g1_i1.p1 TRINITY_DN17179_c0_g1~~TRINITY_DN17179_c0_g1_i1.p1  ORF type:complete len:180 (+),score=36.16 TRINITY_DN17179_c0_g1_i1:97-636(+)
MAVRTKKKQRVRVETLAAAPDAKTATSSVTSEQAISQNALSQKKCAAAAQKNKRLKGMTKRKTRASDGKAQAALRVQDQNNHKSSGSEDELGPADWVERPVKGKKRQRKNAGSSTELAAGLSVLEAVLSKEKKRSQSRMAAVLTMMCHLMHLNRLTIQTWSAALRFSLADYRGKSVKSK